MFDVSVSGMMPVYCPVYDAGYAERCDPGLRVRCDAGSGVVYEAVCDVMSNGSVRDVYVLSVMRCPDIVCDTRMLQRCVLMDVLAYVS